MNIIFDLYKEDLSNYILSLEESKLKEILKDKSVREHLLKDENHYAFIWLIGDLKKELLPYILDEDLIPYLLNKPNIKDIFNGIMANPNSSFFFLNDKIFNSFMESQIYTYYSIDNLELANKMLDYDIQSGKTDSIRYFTKEVQTTIFNNPNNYNRISKLNSNFLLFLENEIIEDLLKKEFYASMLDNYSFTNMHILLSRISYLPSNAFSKRVFNYYLEIKDINEYRKYLLEIKNDNLRYIIEEERKKQYISEFNNIKNGLLPFYNKIYEYIQNDKPIAELLTNLEYSLVNSLYEHPENALNILKEASVKKMLEMTVDMSFRDFTYNNLKNIEQMVNYIGNREDLVTKDRLDIYNKLLNYYDLPDEDRRELFNKLCNIRNNEELFYDDYRKCKNDSYKDICSNNLSNIKKSFLSESFNLPVYNLEGEDFNILITCTRFKRESNTKGLYRMWNRPGETVSLSLISNNNLTTYGNPDEEVILGFNINPDNIMHVYESDSYTVRKYSTNRIQRIMTKEDLIKNTKGYNEIQVVNKDYYGNGTVFPGYVISYDNIKPGDLLYAKEYNLPIIIVDTKKYIDNKTLLDTSGDKYLDYNELSMIKDYRRYK